MIPLTKISRSKGNRHLAGCLPYHFVLWLDLSQDHPPSLVDVIRVYKSITTVTWIKHIKANHLSWPGPLWQRGYHDRVIRDTAELEQKRHYIRDNPRRLAEKLAAKANNTPHPR